MIAITIMPQRRTMTMDAKGLADYIMHVNLARIDYDHATRQVVLYIPQSPFDQLLSPDEKMSWNRDFLGISMGGCCG